MHKNVYPKHVAPLLIIIIFSMIAGGCNLKRIVINSSYLMVEEAQASFFEEPDTQFALDAAPANLKLIEGMARGVPENGEIQLAAAKMLSMYAFGFLEDCCSDEDVQEKSNERARGFYLRGRSHAIRTLDLESDFSSLMDKDLDTFTAGLSEYDEDQVPALFWAAFSWGLYINVSRSDISAVAALPKVAAMAERVAQLDESYFYGGAHMFLMVFYGSMGKALGGDPDKAKAHFEKAWELGGGKFLMTKYLFAKYYCQQTLDRELFEKLAAEILDAPDDLLPEQRLPNALAKEKVARMLSAADDVF
jgi:TRAP transporter T-component